MPKYLSCGNIMSDRIIGEDGSESQFHLGGPAMFGLEGIAFWEKDAAMCCNGGDDWGNGYGEWLDLNGYPRDFVTVIPGETTRCYIRHLPNGKYQWGVYQGIENVAKYNLNWKNVYNAVSRDTKGIYLFHASDSDVFDHMDEIRSKGDFRIMWEIGRHPTEGIEDFDKAINLVEGFSCNKFESSEAFGLDAEDDDGNIAALRGLPVEFVFYRVGKKGSYGITKDEVWFCPSVDHAGKSVDPSGCGNCSTAAAMHAWVEGRTVPEIIAEANISAGFNAAVYGVWPHITDADRIRAEELREQALRTAVRVR
ncbi:MAG: carbohydrate kinase family protein [Oscillospiraceae bacterium]|nr:carbohydrate kinase family protein [Oscillospiraceae bacterium]